MGEQERPTAVGSFELIENAAAGCNLNQAVQTN